MENRPLAEYTMPELCEALRIAKEGRDNEMSPERASQYHARYMEICYEIYRRIPELQRRTYLGNTIEIDKSVDKSIDLDPPVSRWDRFWIRYGDYIFWFLVGSLISLILHAI